MKVVRIENVGNVRFPDAMSEDDVNKASGKLHAQANPQASSGTPAQAHKFDLTSVMEFVASNRPKEQAGQTTSDHLKALAATAKVLEENPTLARLAIAGLQALKG
jgi:hypothetical protein